MASATLEPVLFNGLFKSFGSLGARLGNVAGQSANALNGVLNSLSNSASALAGSVKAVSQQALGGLGGLAGTGIGAVLVRLLHRQSGLRSVP